MSGLTLVTYPGDFRAFKCLVAAKINGISVAVNEKFEVGKTNKTKEFLAKSPLGKVPILETPEGVLLESNAIMRHLARHRNDTQLFGSSFFEHAQVDSWVDWCQNELEIPVTMWLFPLFGFMAPNPKQVGKAREDTKKAMKVLENHLRLRTFMVGRQITLADIAIAGALVYPFKMVFDAKFRQNFPSVTRWFLMCAATDAFVQCCNEINLCKTEQQLQKGAGKKQKKEKKQKQQKKADKPKPKKKKKPQRVRHPLDCLDKSDFVMDTWKKTYSNSKPDYYKSMDYFWKNIDLKGYSLWECKYKYNEENKVDWLCSNKIGGYIQRLDEVRKYAFGVMAVLETFEKSGCYEVTGAWLMRGDSIKFLLDCHEEGETFQWRNMGNPTDAEKKWIADLWCGDTLSGSGVGVNDSCVFK